MFYFEVVTCSLSGSCNTGPVQHYISPEVGCGVVPNQGFLYGTFFYVNDAGEFPALVFNQNWTENILGNTSLTMICTVSWLYSIQRYLHGAVSTTTFDQG